MSNPDSLGQTTIKLLGQKAMNFIYSNCEIEFYKEGEESEKIKGSPMKYVKVMSEEDLPIGKSAIISAGEDEIALFNYKGKYYAVANKCPHRGAPLGEGTY